MEHRGINRVHPRLCRKILGDIVFREPFESWKITSMDDLLEIARSMEQEAIDGYVALEKRMTDMGRSDLSEVFRSLVAEEQGHLQKVEEWRDSHGRKAPEASVAPPSELFDDEGAGLVAPELLTAYRAFSTAVRNEERAFVFWSYVSAHANLKEIRNAAERMAHEELGHVAKLRRERRKAFHHKREAATGVRVDLKTLEESLARHLEIMAAGSVADEAKLLLGLAAEANLRARSLGAQFMGKSLPSAESLPMAADQARPLSEFLLDCYLDLGERAVTGEDAERARSFAAQLINCVRALGYFKRVATTN